MGARLFLGSILFLFIFSFFMAEITGTTMELLSPLTLGISTAAIVIIIGAANTPVVKGIAAAVLFTDLFIHFIFTSVPIEILGIMIAPIILSMGLAMAEVGQG